MIYHMASADSGHRRFTFSLLIFFLIWVLLLERSYAVPSYGLNIHHRFSDRVRQWAESWSRDLPGGWPEKGTVEYYAALAGHDRALRGRALAGEAPELTFADGNATLMISSLGFLHYALVSLGTPNVTFLVALDTGSDLFWVPCDCTNCAPSASEINGGVDFNIYRSNLSSTSEHVPCNSSLCGSQSQNKCSRSEDICPYMVQYVSGNTSTSGYLVKDVLYLSTEDTQPQLVKAPIVFGCGQVQTGSFLESGAPNGLFGLGIDKLSIPSILASMSFTSNSFSMCFGNDGLGRITFGDQGSTDQKETPFNIKQRRPTYNVSITGIEVGSSFINVSFTALVDSGTSFTYLADPAYTKLAENFAAQVQEEQAKTDSSMPFEYCYSISIDESAVQLPDIKLTTQGGSQFPVNYPAIFISNRRRPFLYCLAILKSSKLNIIGQNFLTGLRVVFDRERMILGWKMFNCYETENSSTLPVKPHNSSALPPVHALGPEAYNPEATKEEGNGTQVTIVPTPNSRAYNLKCFSILTIITLMLFSDSSSYS